MLLIFLIAVGLALLGAFVSMFLVIIVVKAAEEIHYKKILEQAMEDKTHDSKQ